MKVYKRRDFFGKCGCNCGHCPAFKGNIRSSKDKKSCRDGWNKYLGTNMKKFGWIICDSCQAADPWKSGNILPDHGCYIRPCVVKMGIETCAQCVAFPCADLKRRIPDKDFRKRIEKRLGERISNEDYKTFVEPYEGIEHLKEIRKSLKKKDLVKILKIPPLKVRVVDFPDNLPLPKKEKLAFKAIHKLFKKILTGRTKTFARQEIIKRRKNNLLSLLWCFGLYGKIIKKKETHLIIDSKTVKSVPAFTNFVRKRDNSLHSTAAQCFMIFRDYGIRTEYEPIKKEWIMELSFNKHAGGVDALKALKKYINTLVKLYGRPKYTGASKYKGESYKKFAKADMRIFL